MIKSTVSQENQTRGTFDFPLEYYFVDRTHPRYQMPFHWHIEYELILIDSGAFTLRLDDETIEMNAGDAVLIPDGFIHGGLPHDCVYECAVFDFARFLEETTIGKRSLLKVLTETALRHHVFPTGSKPADIIQALMVELRNKKFGYELTVHGLIWQLMGSLVDETSRNPAADPHPKDWRRIDQMKKVLRRIRKDYATDLTLQDLADEANLVPKYLCRAFRDLTGRTPIEYLNYYRIECAAEKMIVTTEHITEIALACGFHDLSYFSKTFKKYKGMSARDFRNNRIARSEAEPAESNPN